MFACPGCGAGLRFDIKSQKLHCDYCDSSYEVDTYPYEKSAKENNSIYEVTVFTCPACGGEIESTENEIIQFCPFCGASDILASRMEGRKRPQRIIPFQKTKEDCMESFREKAKKALFAPRELRDPAFLEGFRGIYLPYWEYEVLQGSEGEGVTFEATKTSKGYEDTYKITVPLAGKLEGIQHDASSSFDDDLGEEIAPFGGESAQKEFQPGYLAGFYADTADVPAEVYTDKVRQYANERTKKELTKNYTRKGYSITKFPDEDKAFHTTIQSVDRMLLPVWFLTWRKNGRVAYSVVNGETGKIAADIPVDIKRYLGWSLLLSLPIFLLLNLFLSATAPSAMTVSGYLAAVCGFIYLWNMRKIIRRDTHENDLGYRYVNGSLSGKKKPKERGSKNTEEGGTPARKETQKAGGAGYSFARMERPDSEELIEGAKKTIRKAPGKIWDFIKSIGPASSIVLAIMILSLAEAFDGGMMEILGSWVLVRSFSSGMMTFLIFVQLVLTLWTGRKAPDKRMIAEALLPSVAMAAVTFVLKWNPIEDYIYYIGMLVCLVLIALTLTALIFRYNMLSTHPIPNFHDRKGGNGNAAAALLLALVLPVSLLAPAKKAFAWTEEESVVYTNEYTGYSAFIRDEEDLLTPEEEAELADYMAPMTDYGNVMFLSADGDYMDPVDYLETYYGDWFYEDGTIFLIEMSNRQLRLENSGDIQNTITASYSDSIMDNVYRMASDGDYLGCAEEVFYECTVLMDGGHIARPMKYICNALLALILALLVNYAAIRVTTRNHRITKQELAAAVIASVVYGGAKTKRTAHRKINTSSGGGGSSGGGFSGGGGGGGGGGHSGGGHGF